LEKEANKKQNKAKDKKVSKSKSEQKKKLSFREKKEFESLEEQIMELEIKKEAIINEMNEGAGNHEKMIGWSKEIEKLTSLIEEKEFRWLELSELA
jgi:ATP-binding cassette subfamily F protein uup